MKSLILFFFLLISTLAVTSCQIPFGVLPSKHYTNHKSIIDNRIWNYTIFHFMSPKVLDNDQYVQLRPINVKAYPNSDFLSYKEELNMKDTSLVDFIEKIRSDFSTLEYVLLYKKENEYAYLWSCKKCHGIGIAKGSGISLYMNDGSKFKYINYGSKRSKVSKADQEKWIGIMKSIEIQY